MAEVETPPRTYKHQQHLKVQKENEEETWISGEELRTDGSSDEANTAEKPKARKKSKGKKKVAVVPPEKPEAQNEEACSSSTDIRWRPKRGSLKLPDLFDACAEKVADEANFLQDIVDNVELFKFLPASKHEEIFDKKFNRREIEEMFRSIEDLEKKISEEDGLLQAEKEERIKTQEEMCEEICRDRRFYSRNASLFLNMCHFEETSKHSESEDEDADEEDRAKKRRVKIEDGRRDFVKRNIELAARAMTSLPLTDEEKGKLDELLSDIVNEDVKDKTENEAIKEGEEEINVEDEEIDQSNPFQVSYLEKNRISEIDTELLENFTETQGLKLARNEDEETLWKALALEKNLREIDQKLAALATHQKEEETSE